MNEQVAAGMNYPVRQIHSAPCIAHRRAATAHEALADERSAL